MPSVSPLGSGSSLLMILLVICVASLVGTALRIFKKSRDKPAVYTLLAYGDQQHNKRSVTKMTGIVIFFFVLWERIFKCV